MSGSNLSCQLVSLEQNMWKNAVTQLSNTKLQSWKQTPIIYFLFSQYSFYFLTRFLSHLPSLMGMERQTFIYSIHMVIMVERWIIYWKDLIFDLKNHRIIGLIIRYPCVNRPFFHCEFIHHNKSIIIVSEGLKEASTGGGCLLWYSRTSMHKKNENDFRRTFEQ